MALSPDSGPTLPSLYSLIRSDSDSFYGKVYVSIDALGFIIPHLTTFIQGVNIEIETFVFWVSNISLHFQYAQMS